MTSQPTSKIELLRSLYKAFNDRDLDTALAPMTANVHWPRAFKGGFVRGPEEVRAYWIEQGSEIDAHVEPVDFSIEEDGRIVVNVHQTVRDLNGNVLSDGQVGHRYTFENSLIQGMKLCDVV